MIFEKGYSIKITGNRCLNQRNRGVACRHCQESCPTGALSSDDEGVYLHQDSCSGCGLCFSDCPTQTFSSSQWDETSIITDVEEEGWKITEFFCGRHSSPYKRDKNRERGAVRLPACLSSLSKGAWYELGLKTDLELHLEQCAECPNADTLDLLKLKAMTACEWLEASGFKPEFNFIHQSSTGKTKRSLQAIESGLKVTSRRDLFLSIIHRGRQLDSVTPHPVQPFPRELDQEQRISYIPDWQKRLAQIYPKNVKGVFAAAYWPTLKVNDDCVNCGMCSSFCPSGALRLVVNNGSCTHYLVSGLCLDCRICQLFCPREAITRDREKVEDPFAITAVYEASVISCRRCSSTTLNNSGQLCFWCSERMNIDTEFNESCHKLLLKRGS